MNRILLLLAGATLYLSLSGFQCASSQMNTAELALKSNNYAKAATALEEEVSLRPDNGRAWYLLGVARYETGAFRTMKDAFIKAKEHAASQTGKVEPREMLDMEFKMFNSWAQLYDSATIVGYKDADYAKGLALLDDAEYILPKMPAVVEVKSNLLLRQKNRDQANKLYGEYVRLVRGDIEKGVKDGLSLGMTRNSVQVALGKPTLAYNPDRFQFTDQYPSGLSVYYTAAKSKEDDAKVQGWKYYGTGDAPYLNYWLSSDPLFNAALDDYANKRYDEALELLRLIEQFDPALEEVGSLIGQIYIATNRTDEAKALLVRKIQEDPNNPKLRITYSVLLHDAKEYGEAVKVLQEALKLDLDKSEKDYQDILYNLGAFYKNWAVKLENEATGSSAQREEYEAKYRESLNYFTQLRSVQGEVEYELLAEMGNLHALLGNKQGLKDVVKEFEGLKGNEAMKNDAGFWRVLSDLYSYLGEADKSAEAKAKAASLGS